MAPKISKALVEVSSLNPFWLQQIFKLIPPYKSNNQNDKILLFIYRHQLEVDVSYLTIHLGEQQASL